MKGKLKYLTLTLVVLLLVSVSINIIQAREPGKPTLHGTFLHDSNTIVVFSQRPPGLDGGVFFMYQEWDVLAEGYFSYLGNGIYELTNRQGEFIKQILHQGERVFTFGQNNEIMEFGFFDSMGMFTTVHPDEDFWFGN